ncbi:hypothetical protein CC86DRAFT_118258 [Ophiobolus disseminans]|uniref:F-box domain-containing protein n=1 Tax=Ophiobolus disseminans TaxID=1469910 RepID=A0A6A6ZJ08_9PLEO|nr:hypothetical protein CC86DRAFT_118258 [Ophiobolus disseminans]
MTLPWLPDIPAEIYRRICTLLPSRSALDFLLVNHFVYNACDDWTIWREVIRRNGDFVLEHLARHMGDTRAWKRYVIADSKSNTSDEPTTTDVVQWLLQLTALNHPVISSMDVAALVSICDSILHTPFSTTDTEHSIYKFSCDFESPHDIQTWQLAQASAFCLTAHLLSQTCPTELPENLLGFVAWINVSGVQRNSPHYLKLTCIQHAFANRAVDYLSSRLRYLLVHCRSSPRATEYIPPTFSAISPATTMELPMPYSRNAAQEFSKCHLPCILDPRILTGDEWTGHLSAEDGDKDVYSGIGAHNTELVYNNDRGQYRDPEDFPHGRDFEPIVRFQLVEPYDSTHDTYTLESNNFYSSSELHRLTVRVEKSTGRLSIAHWHLNSFQRMASEAVITPFGIVSGMVPYKLWLWMWKKSWSMPLAEII